MFINKEDKISDFYEIKNNHDVKNTESKIDEKRDDDNKPRIKINNKQIQMLKKILAEKKHA